MECEVCHQRSATVHFTQIINHEKWEKHLCEVCAQEREDQPSQGHHQGYTIQDLLSGIFGYGQDAFAFHKQKQHVTSNEPLCPKCNMTYARFLKTGKFGCAQCYDTFKDRLDPVLRRVHAGNTTHKGKIPKRAGQELNVKRQITELKTAIHELIDKEEFEKAAVLRDEIRSLQGKLKEGDQ
ncbi:UvrB/UvrC motif-containing protein [Aureibacillus halotolerans]|uniref:Protein arginine kinase activator n=1 Tax=Aureibacillus halotolerans TaxID=1508390 RepID=A0A4R6TQ97_9BACI|nr:UvrB/UvrC motif-containing protein [Aureibacillus halotolerans]TDQ34679.1 protein arginine kinase activator [Aureibacillus halotolerans]